MQAHPGSQPTANVEDILAIVNREWQKVFAREKDAQPMWAALEPLLRRALATIPPPPDVFPDADDLHQQPARCKKNSAPRLEAWRTVEAKHLPRAA